MIHTIKDFGIVNKAEVDAFLEFPCFFYDPVDFGSLIFGYSAFSKPNSNIWKFSVHVLLMPSLEILSITLLACEMGAVMQRFECSLALLFFGTGMKIRTFSSPMAPAEFSKFASILSTALSQHHILGFEIGQLEFNHLY